MNLNQRSGLTFKKNAPCMSKGYLDDGTEIETLMLISKSVTPFAWVDHKESYDQFRLVVGNTQGKKNYFSFKSEQRSW